MADAEQGSGIARDLQHLECLGINDDQHAVRQNRPGKMNWLAVAIRQIGLFRDVFNHVLHPSNLLPTARTPQMSLSLH